jgi:uncharacterized membrane protein YccC
MVTASNPFFLPVADEALEKGYVELLRAGIADKPLFVSLNPHVYDSPDEWGWVLAEITLTLATHYSADGMLDENAVIAAVTEGYKEWLRKYLASAAAKPKAPAKGKVKAPAKTLAKAEAAAPSEPKARAKPASKSAKTAAKPAARLAGKAAAGRKGARKA